MSLFNTYKTYVAINMACGFFALAQQGCATDLTDESAIPPGEFENNGPTGPFGQPVEVFNDLLIDPFMAQTPFNTQPVSGRGPANGSLLVTQNGKTQAHAIQNSGTFCVDIPLTSNATNELTFQALNIDGVPVLANPLKRQIIQSGTPPENQTPVSTNPVLENVGPTAHNVFSNMDFDGPGVNAFTGWEEIFNDPNQTTLVKNHTFGKNYFNFDVVVTSPLFSVVLNSDGQEALNNIEVYYSNSDNGLDLFSNWRVFGEEQTVNPGWFKWGEVPFQNSLTEKTLIAPNGYAGTEATRIAIHFTNVEQGFWADLSGAGEHRLNSISINAIDVEATASNNNNTAAGQNTCLGGGR